MELANVGGKRRVFTEVDLVVESDVETEGEGAQAAREGGCVDLGVESVAERRKEGEVDKTTCPFSSASVCFGRRRCAERGGRWRCEDAEGQCLVKDAALKVRVRDVE